mgnify:CR=1 FL=1
MAQWKISFSIGKSREISPRTFKNKAIAKKALKRALDLRKGKGKPHKSAIPYPYQDIKNPRVVRKK